MNKKQSIILLIVGVLLLLLGIAIGVLLGAQTASQNIKNEITNSLSSKVISSITTYGQVTKIEGRSVTLSYSGDNLVVLISNSARIYSLTTATDSTIPVQKTSAFEDIKIGDNVNVVLKVLSTGQIEGSSVIIFPAVTE